MAWSGDGRLLAAAGHDHRVRLWDAASSELRATFQGHELSVTGLAWSADDRILASSSLDGTVILWDVETARPQGRPLDSLIGEVAAVAWHGDDLAVASRDGRVVVWDVPQGGSGRARPRGRPSAGQRARLRSLAWSGDGQLLAAGHGHTVVLWDNGDGPRLARSFHLGADEVKRSALGPDGTTMVLVARDLRSRERVLRRWDAERNEPIGAPLAVFSSKMPLLLAFDGATAVTVDQDGSVRRWPAPDTAAPSDQAWPTAWKEALSRARTAAWNVPAARLAVASRDDDVLALDATGQSWKLATRSEGVRQRELVSGASFPLLAVELLAAEASVASPGAELHLHFRLPEPRVLDDISVSEPELRYWMVPDRKEYGDGWQDFVWPRDAVVGPLGVAVSALRPRVKAGDTYFPALLSTRAEPDPSTGYAFVFASGDGIDVFTTIVRRDTGEELWQGDHYDDSGGVQVIEWNGRDAQDRPVPAGYYELRVRGDMLSESQRRIDTRVAFWHAGEGRTP